MGSLPYDYDLDILVIGGGLSGCYSLYSLRKLNPKPSIKLVEAGGDFGGTWYYNRYPGARVDSEWPVYQLSIPEVWKDWSFRDRFPDHKQIRAYVKHMDEVLDLSRDTFFNTTVDEVHWDDNRKRWDTHTKDGKRFTSRHLIVCTGSSYKRYSPDFKGLHEFRGKLLHSAAYPDGGVDISGKRVGLIGSGATAVQIVQELAKQDCELINFIRTPNQAVPMQQRKVSPEETTEAKPGYADLLKRMKNTRGGFPTGVSKLVFKDASNEERDAELQRAWDHGGFAYLGIFGDYWFDTEANAYMYNFWAKKTRPRIKDPEKREIMAPLVQGDFFGTRRVSLEQDYFECLDRPNVKIVNLKKNGIREIVDKGVVTEDGKLHEVDILILATGFDALNGSQMALGLHDKNGISLREKWSKGTLTYLGIQIPDMPNLWMSYGPQGPAAIGNAPTIIEMAIDWIARAIQKMEDEGIETVEPRREEAEGWAKDIYEVNAATLVPRTSNGWWTGSNIPGKFKEQLNYLKGFPAYSVAIEDALDGWKGFELGKAAEG